MFQVNQQIGPYTLVRELGKGGFGVVWLAEKRSQVFTKIVALKLAHKEHVNFETVRKEAVLWERASGHPNVLPIIDAEIYDGQIVIVSEFADGGSLDDMLRNVERFPPAKAVETTIGILDGLEYLHGKGIIHRDIKPHNVLLQGNTPRLCDFGISRALQATTVSAIAAGTDAYMSPEAFDGKRSVQTDIWSVGIVLYQLLKGELPFPQEHPSERMFAILTKDFGPLPGEVPAPLREIVGKALSKDPESRYQSAAEMRNAVQNSLVSGYHFASPPTENLLKPDISAFERETPMALPTELLRQPTAVVTEPWPQPKESVKSTTTAAIIKTTQTGNSTEVLADYLADSSRTGPFGTVKYFIAAAVGLLLLLGGLFGLGQLWRSDRAGVSNVNSEATAVNASPNNQIKEDPNPVSIVSPTPTPVPTPIPPSDRNGRYSDGYGTVIITDADEKGFAFKMNVGNSHGVGALEGRAAWTNRTTAVHTDIPDGDNYNDPTSSTFQKKCKVTFKFSGSTLKTSEDSPACMWWHGAAATLSGTYPLKKPK